MGSKKQKVRFPISVKLIVIVSILVVTALGVITGLVSYIISNDTQVTQESYNLTINSRSAAEAFNMINSVRSNTFLLLDMLNSIGSSEGIGR
jgi:adenylate cyclase